MATPPLHGFPAKCGLRNEHRNSPLMTCYYPELGSASDWLKIGFNLSKKSTTQIWIVTCHGMDSALLPQASSCGKPSLQSRNASRFLGFNLFSQFAMSLLKLAQLKFLSTCFSPGENRRNLVWSTYCRPRAETSLSRRERQVHAHVGRKNPRINSGTLLEGRHFQSFFFLFLFHEFGIK